MSSQYSNYGNYNNSRRSDKEIYKLKEDIKLGSMVYQTITGNSQTTPSLTVNATNGLVINADLNGVTINAKNSLTINTDLSGGLVDGDKIIVMTKDNQIKVIRAIGLSDGSYNVIKSVINNRGTLVMEEQTAVS